MFSTKSSEVKFRKLYRALTAAIFFSLFLFLDGCGGNGLFSRKSTIYGNIIDINDAPVDSIIIGVSVSKFLSSGEISIDAVTTDRHGNYEAVVDVPKGYSTLMIFISNVNNPGYTDNYKDFQVYQDGKRIDNCCTAKIGGKTRYDFKVLP